ncbi:MAG: cysteine peptidase family C39 domain-containing protein [Eubacteriales bacterium]|nr:cysteine peptidase family C39 domain-containing protein [Eubacteriales bacterium]
MAKQHGFKMPIAKIREIAGTDKQGTNALGMIKTAESLGIGDMELQWKQKVSFFGLEK